MQVFELGEGFVGGDECVVAGECEGGEIGVHPKFGGGGVAGGEFFPLCFESGGFGGDGDAGVGEECLREVPCGGVGEGRETVEAHDFFGGQQAEEGVVGGAAEQHGLACGLGGEPVADGGVEMVLGEREGDPEIGIKEIHGSSRPPGH